MGMKTPFVRLSILQNVGSIVDHLAGLWSLAVAQIGIAFFEASLLESPEASTDEWRVCDGRQASARLDGSKLGKDRVHPIGPIELEDSSMIFFYK
jgi:hypothetical protein